MGKIKKLMVGAIGVLTCFVLTYVLKEVIFDNTFITVDWIFIYSILNFFFALVLFIFISTLCLIFEKFSIQNYFSLFILCFCFTFELILLLVLYNQLTWLGIDIPFGACPWKWLRVSFTIFFIITYLSIYKVYSRINKKVLNQKKKENF